MFEMPADEAERSVSDVPASAMRCLWGVGEDRNFIEGDAEKLFNKTAKCGLREVCGSWVNTQIRLTPGTRHGSQTVRRVQEREGPGHVQDLERCQL